jgi:hypothetical protein
VVFDSFHRYLSVGAIVPIAYVGWSVWLMSAGLVVLVS